MEIGLSMGSNLGDRLANLQRARQKIRRLPGIEIAAQAPVYETEPVDVRADYERFSFLNTILILSSADELSASRMVALLNEFKHIEHSLGRRDSSIRNEPRRMDLDIVYAGEATVDLPELTLPHPRWTTRRFVLQPLADVRPDLVIPGETRPVQAVLDALPAGQEATVFENEWLAGIAVFDNSFGQNTQFMYVGKTWPIMRSEYWYVKLMGGLLHGYKEPYEDKIPLNSLGIAPAILPALGFRYRRVIVEANLAGIAALTITAGIRF